MYKILLTIFMITFSYSQFDWDPNGIPVRQGYHVEWFRGGDISSDGAMFIVWSDTRTSSRNIYMQKVDASGNVLWTDGGILISGGEGRQEDPIIIADNDGGAYISWRSYANDSLYGELYIQHVSSDGALSWNEKLISNSTYIRVNSQQNMCSDLQGGTYVSWYEDASAGDGYYYIVHIDSQGNIVGPDPIIQTQENYGNVSLESAGNGDAAIAWKQGPTDNEDVYSQRVGISSDSIVKKWNDGQPLLVCDALGKQTSTKVTYYSDEYVIVVWEDWRSDDNLTAVGGNFIDNDGNLVFSEGNDIVFTNDQPTPLFPRVKASSDGAFVVWLSADDVHYVQKIVPSDISVWSSPVSLSTSETQQQARLSSDNNGGVYITWENGEYDEKSIALSHLNSEGVQTYSTKILSDINSEQFASLVRVDDSYGAFVVWGSGSSNYNGISSLGLEYQYIELDGQALTNPIELFYGFGGQIEKGTTRSIQFDNSNNLIYWQDYRDGTDKPKTYGTLLNQDGTSTEYNLSNYSSKQIAPELIRVDQNTLALSFYNSDGKVFFQLLNNNLEKIGEAIAVYEGGSEQANDNRPHIMSSNYNSDGEFFIGYTGGGSSGKIYLQKYSTNGSALWDENKEVASETGDNSINKLYPTSDNGLILIHDNQSFFEKAVRVTKLDNEGSITHSSQMISESGVKSFYENSVNVGDEAFVVLRDEDQNIYAKYILLDQNITIETISISSSESLYNNTVTLDYNQNSNDISICWQEQISSAYNIFCSLVNLETLEASSPSPLYDNSDVTQKNPKLEITNAGTYLISWEDERQGNYSDLFLQEYTSTGQSILDNEGSQLCSAPFNQYNRGVEQLLGYDEKIAFWEDDRSSGKEFVTNIFAQKVSLTEITCPSLGDINDDGLWNVLDIVTLANCVLNASCPSLTNSCAGDMNNDGSWNVLDIVSLANCVLSGTCNS